MARPNLPQFEPDYDFYKMRTLVDELSRWIDTVELGESGAGSGSGVTVHNDLTGRSVENAHPITAITALQTTLNGKASVASVSLNTANISANAVALDQARTQRYFFGE